VAGGLPARTVNGFAADPANPQVMYVAMRDGLFKSTDAGRRWTALRKGPTNAAAVAVNPRQPAEVYASTVEGVIYRSRDGGQTWARQK
jgi:photosystem II stability/assembly factor-like uncharacterized protein